MKYVLMSIPIGDRMDKKWATNPASKTPSRTVAISERNCFFALYDF
jgi:hypothetical protein